MNLKALGEFGLIERLAGSLAGDPIAPAAGGVTLSIGDDAALLRPPDGAEVVATIDGLIEEVHFRRDWTRPEDLGWKALAVNVSDLGAMGAAPLAALITLGLPPDTSPRWIERLYQGLAKCSERYGCPVVGGDTVRSPRAITLSIAALGTVPAGRAVLRSGARPGDLVCVTGVVGESAAGLELLSRGVQRRKRYCAPLVDWHHRPEPPVRAGIALAEAGLATTMLDLSDGIASDAGQLGKRSGVGVRIEAARLPISDSARRAAADLGIDPLRWALFGGEDYQLLFTVPEARFPKVPPCLAPHGAVATVIGRATRRGLTWIDADGAARPLRPEGFAHFSG